MTKCEEFLEFVDFLMQNCKEPVHPSESVQAYLDALRSSERTSEKKEFTSNGKAILQWLQGAPAGMYKARDVAEAIEVSSRAVSGAMRKLVNDGYIEKVGKDPVVYSITEKGKNVIFEDESESEGEINNNEI